MVERKERPDPNKSLVGFMVGQVVYALPIGAVREIIHPVGLTELPHLPEGVAGVADHRGDVIVVVDLRARFGLPPPEGSGRRKWILVDIGGKTVGLVVDQVTDVFGTGSADLQPAPLLGDGQGQRGIAGVISHRGTLTFVLDVSSFETLTAAIDDEALRRAAAVGAT